MTCETKKYCRQRRMVPRKCILKFQEKKKYNKFIHLLGTYLFAIFLLRILIALFLKQGI